MAEISIVSLTTVLFFFFFFSRSLSVSGSLQDYVSDDDNNGSFFTVSSFRYPKSQVSPYDTRYIRGLSVPSYQQLPLLFLLYLIGWFLMVMSELCFFLYTVDLPPWFSSLNVAIESDVDIVSSSYALIFSPNSI